MINIAVIGAGYWGPNLIRNFSKFNNSSVRLVADFNENKLKKIKNLYPAIEVTQSADDVFNSSEIDAVIVATPVFLHYDFAKKALLSGKHVLVEKPMTDSAPKASELVDIAREKGKVLMVDHTFLYTGAVKKIKQIVSEKHVGEIQYFDSVRINLGLFQSDINVLWDLAPHDISILQYIDEELPCSVVATGICHTENEIENIAYLTLNYTSNKIAHFTLSWTSPVKIRKILIGGTRKMIVFDDIEPTEKVKVYDTGYKVKTKEDKEKILVDYRAGDIYIPKLDATEALEGMAKDFLNAVEEGTEPVSNWKSGLNVVRILDAAQKSIKNKGKEVLL